MSITEKCKSVDKVQSYIDKCFIDSFNAEGREFNPSAYVFRFVLVKSSIDGWHLIPLISRCKYHRVLRRVEFRLDRNLYKNFGIHYGKTDDLRFITYDDYDDGRSIVDPNHCKAHFNILPGDSKLTKTKGISLSLFEEDYYEMEQGECMVAAQYEKLLFKYWNMDANTYRRLPHDSKKQYLPDKFGTDFAEFDKLYYQTFGKPVGHEFEFICGPGVHQYIHMNEEVNHE